MREAFVGRQRDPFAEPEADPFGEPGINPLTDPRFDEHPLVEQWRKASRRSTYGWLVAAMSGCLGGAVASGLGLFRWYGQSRLGDVALVGLVATAIIAGHAATTLTTWPPRRTLREAIGLQIPYLLTYAVVLIWVTAWRFPPGYVAWFCAVAVTISWLTVWYLGNPRQAQRAVAFLAALAVLLVGNAAAALAIGWRHTNGYGLVGQPTPWAAMEALASTSCLTGMTAYPSGDHIVMARCPQDADAYGATTSYDTEAFGQQLCTEQPRAAFGTWWDNIRRYDVPLQLDFGASPTWDISVDGTVVGKPRPSTQAGTSALMTVPVRLVAAIRPGDLPDAQKYPVRYDTSVEHWQVKASRTSLGGWKVCSISVADPIALHPATG